MTRALPVYVALGSNLGNRKAHIREACQTLAAFPGCYGFHCSALYQTAPMGPQDQPDFLNAVCMFFCRLLPGNLLRQLQALEVAHGRCQTGKVRWGARELDLDLLLYGSWTIATTDLTVPHIGLADRSFVLWPLHELSPALQVPGAGSVAELVKQLETGGRTYGIKRLDE